MDGAELSKPELAYLLAAVSATGLVGVEDSQLFPTKKTTRETAMAKGREQLESNGWISPVPDHADEYDLNPALLQMAAVAGAPRMVVATSRHAAKGAKHMLLHYVSGEHIVELWAPSKKGYVLAVVPDQEALHARIAEMLDLEDSAQEASAILAQADFKKLQKLALAGKAEQAMDLLSGLELNGAVGDSLVAALGQPASGELVVARPEAGEIAAGRRATVFGAKDSAWRVIRQGADTEDLELATFDSAGIGALVMEWMSALTEG